MKKVMIVLMVISALCFRCKSTVIDCSTIEPKDIALKFSVIDNEGNDLFFGYSSIYDPYEVKFAVGQEYEVSQDWFHVSENCFLLSGFYPIRDENPYIFYMEFVPNDIDTLTVEYRILPDKYKCFPFFEYDLSFNNIQVCVNCDIVEIYKITKP